MSKYHVNSKGEAGQCRAKTGGCPFGGESEHFDSAAEAQVAAEKKLEQQYSEVSTVAKKQGEMTNTFGEHDVPQYDPYNSGRKVIDFVSPERHDDGSYTLHIDATDYANALKDEWYSDASGVIEFQDDGDFLSITSRAEAESEADRIAKNANKEIQNHYIDNPDKSIDEVIDHEYAAAYDSALPSYDVNVSGTVDVVDADDLVEYWEENRDEDED